ncbi:ABC transporter permease [Calidifontibacter terrae]
MSSTALTPSVRPYWKLFRAGIRQQATYRLAMFGGLLANATFGLLKTVILGATVTAGGGMVGGYNAAAMATYVWVGQGLLGSLNLNGRLDLADRIKKGDITTDFLRPLDVQSATIATEVGKAAYALLPRGLPSLAIGALAVGLATPEHWTTWPLAVLSLVLGMVISQSTVYLLTTAGFWLVELRGLQTMYMMLSGFLAGLFVPISLFPDWLRVVAECTPFPSMMMYPIDLYVGRTGPGILLVQLFWLVVTWLAGWWLTRLGRARLEVQGG